MCRATRSSHSCIVLDVLPTSTKLPELSDADMAALLAAGTY
jgi:hypothetical protein